MWTRDYGPFFVWDALGELGIVNYTTNSGPYGANDNLFPLNFSSAFRIPYFESGLNHVGGNYYPNGWGTAFSTTEVYTNNPFSTMAEVNAVMQEFFGIDRYHTAVVAPWTIEHHDCWGKPTGPDGMLIAQFDEGSDYHPYAEAMAAHYETLESPWGRPYRIHRIPMFPMGTGWLEFRPYLNALISNTSVFVPITNHPDDALALQAFAQAFEGYQIVGVDHQGTGFNDALHCRTRNFIRRDAIRVYPVPPGDTEDTVAGYPVTADVMPPVGSALLAGYPVIHFTTTGAAPFTDVVMTPTGQPDEYAATLPAQPLGTSVSFYVEARDDGGHQALYPLVAPDGMMHFEVRADTEPPALTRFVPARGVAVAAWPPTIRVLCTDDMATPEVRARWSLNGEPQPDALLAREPGTWWYSGTLPGAAQAGDLVSYSLLASDGAASPNEATLPVLGEVLCPVSGPGGVGIVQLSARPATAPFLAEALGGLGVPYSYYREWPADFSAHDVWFLCLGVFADNHILTAPEAADVVAALGAGRSMYMETGDGWCYGTTKDVLDPWFGVAPVDDGLDLRNGVIGEAGSIVDGCSLVYAGGNDFMDEIAPAAGAQMLFRSDADAKGRAVLYDGGGYRTIASSFLLGGLLDGAWPHTRKELLVRYLDFLGVTGIHLYAGAPAHAGELVPLRLEAGPGQAYALLGSLAETLAPTQYGVFRLDPTWMFTLFQGVVPPSGLVEFSLPIPADEALAGLEVHFQALTGTSVAPPQNAQLTNREILTLR